MNLLDIQNVRHQYSDKVTLQNVSLQLQKGEIGCLLGPSGSGKTTLLRAVAGFEDITAGEINIRGKNVSRAGRSLDSAKRRVGIVFQDLALFPHLTIEKNIGFGLHHLPSREVAARVRQWLDIIGLKKLSRRYPHELSGGEQQRIAVARAMAPEPDLLLMDEPFSSLDVDLRQRLNVEVRAMLKEKKMTALLVTHDQHEAFAFADKVGLLNQGCMEQWGNAYDIYHTPSNQFVADFIGQGVFIGGKIKDSQTVATELGDLKSEQVISFPAGTVVNTFLRPEDVLHDDASPFQVQVLYKAFCGAYILYTLALPSGQKILAHVSSHHNHPIGSFIGIRPEVDHVIYFQDYGVKSLLDT